MDLFDLTYKRESQFIQSLLNCIRTWIRYNARELKMIIVIQQIADKVYSGVLTRSNPTR